MSILILESSGYSEQAISLYSKIGEVYLNFDQAELNTVEILVVRLNYKIGSKLCDQLENLKLVATPTTGLNHLDTDYLSRRGVKIISLRDVPKKIQSISSTTEITIWHIINLVRKASNAVSAVKFNNEWRRDDFKSRQLSSMSIGIVGLGRIGSQVANVCDALGMDVYFYDPYLELENCTEISQKYKSVNSLEKLLMCSDIVSIHVPLNVETEHLFCEKMIQNMNSESYLVNTSRGEIVDETAIVNAIKMNRLSGYACDVLTGEHTIPIEENTLVKFSKTNSNIHMSPHIGGCTVDAMHQTEVIIAEEVLQYFAI
ncbi:NAD(P)-binding domain-containing protein [Paracoccaceae bacterium]|nr:NAD(P)-binding domain-containing protein [Paracoccaceae bacterium]